ncbi:MAG TPA: protein kinase [Terriglobia bacterium]|nr:protein kinase [Terriglobia bacterium]
MTLATGTRIGPFEIVGVLGVGGMGEVYRARDTRLGREAALKLLPDSLASNPDRIARFTREAQVLASLSHPNIGGIYGLEEMRMDNRSLRALVLELVEGETLADRIARGPIPVDDAMPIIRQIAEALQAAHDQTVVHRDLKPANIKITPDGVVKVLDFGLAKLSVPSESGGGPPSSSEAVTLAQTAMDDSPTLTTPATTVGTILGTASYMAPEQAKGRSVDKRSDVWALGCVAYEMLTGVRPFQGDGVADTLAAVLRSEPDWTRLPNDLPSPVANVLRRSLEKDRRTRVGDVAAILFAIEQSRSLAHAPTTARRWKSLLATIVVSGAIAAAVTGLAVWKLVRPESTTVTKLAIAPDEADAFRTTSAAGELAISRDGKRVVYFGGEGRLIVRSLDSLESTVIDGLEGPLSPIFSADGRSIAYIRRNADVRIVPTAGGPSVQRVALNSSQAGGVAWNDDGRIVYATTDRVTGLLDLPPDAKSPTVLTTPNRELGEADHLWPRFLPGGHAVLFTIIPLNGQPGTGQIAVYDFATRKSTIVVPSGTDAHYVPTGHLVYAAGGSLRAIRFDLGTLKTVGESKVVVPSVLTKGLGAADFDVSDNGTLIYAPGGITDSAKRELVWVGRDGTAESLGAPLRSYQYPRLSPDGKRVVLDVRDQDNDLWIWDIRSRTLTRFTNTPALDRFPMWTPDGKYIVYVSDRNGMSAIYRQPADGGGTAELLTNATVEQQTPDLITPDGTRLLFGFKGHIMVMPLDGNRRTTPLFESQAQEFRSVLSLGQRWIAYHSNESGRMEVYVRSFSSPASGKWQVSANGGVEPWWSPKGDELFFVSTETGQLMSVHIPSGPAWTPGPAKIVLKDPYFWGTLAGAAAATFDISSDGLRLLMIRPTKESNASGSTNLIVAQNWFEELKRLVP